MRRLTRTAAAVAALALSAMTGCFVGPAGATAPPKPRNEEWQFAAWEIQNKVWPVTRGQGVTVAVVDSGVNANLPGLGGVVKPGADVRPGGQGDGRIDTDKTNGGHGTGMAELIAGQGQDDGMLGIAPDTKIMPIIVDGSSLTIAKALRYAVDHGAQVINVSLSNPDDPGPTCAAVSPDLQDAVAYAAKKNVVVVAAAGNQGNTVNDPMFPANCPGVLAVGAVDHKKVPWVDSERQQYVAVAAPGYGVGTVGKTGHFLNNISGTSQASALTAGVVALLRAKLPQLSARDLVQRIINTTVDAGKPGVDDVTGSGIVIPTAALARSVDKSAPNPPYDRLDKWLASQNKAPGSMPSHAGKTAADKKSGSGSGSGLVMTVIVIILVIVAIAVVVLLRGRRRGVSHPPLGQGPPAPGPFGPNAGSPDGYPHQSANRPGGPSGPPPSFLPPDDRPGPHN